MLALRKQILIKMNTYMQEIYMESSHHSVESNMQPFLVWVLHLSSLAF